jgi:hypothetical protein
MIVAPTDIDIVLISAVNLMRDDRLQRRGSGRLRQPWCNRLVPL